MSNLIHKELSDVVLNAAFTVHEALGPGLLESAYAGAYVVEIMHAGLDVAREVVYPLEYRGQYIGAYIADVVVSNIIIVELKSAAKLNPLMDAQVINYLKLSGLPVGYLFNFHNRVLEWRRFVNTKPAAT